MSDLNKLIESYLGAWNETNPARRRELIAQSCAEDVSFADPLAQCTGHAGIDAMLQAVQPRFAGYVIRQVGAIDTHHNHVRFSWELAPSGGPALAAGTDFGVLASDGRLQTISGFLDLVPAEMVE